MRKAAEKFDRENDLLFEEALANFAIQQVNAALEEAAVKVGFGLLAKDIRALKIS